MDLSSGLIQIQVIELQMGQGQNNHTHPVLDSNWVLVPRQNSKIFSNVNPYSKRTLRNTQTNEEVEQYELQFVSEQDFRSFTQELRIRMEPSNQSIIQQSNADSYFHLSPYIYTVKYFVNNTLQDMCSTTYKGLLYAQKVDLRLKQINDIPLSDQLYLIKASLQGFKLLYEKGGYFDISEEMIFISKEGKVKVWINSNLSKNEPLFIPYSAYRESHGSQSDMLVQLLDMIEQNSDSQQQEGIHFKQYLIQKNIYNRLSFYRALDQFEAYCNEEHYIVDDSMRSIYELYHQDQPQHSEVLEASVHRINAQPLTQQSKGFEDRLRSEMSPINKHSFSNLHFPNNIQEPNAQLVGSRTSKHSEKQSRHNSHKDTQPEFGRPRSTNNYVQKMAQLEIKMPNQTSLLNPRNLPLARREFQPPQVQLRHESPALQPKRSQTLSIGKDVAFQTHHSKPAVIKFNYLPNKAPFNSQSELEVTKPTPIVKPIEVPSSKPFETPNTPKTLDVQKQLKLPPNLKTIHSIPTESAGSTKQLKSFMGQFERQRRQNSSKITYYSSDETYTLDKQIAEDLQKLLGYSLNS